MVSNYQKRKLDFSSSKRTVHGPSVLLAVSPKISVRRNFYDLRDMKHSSSGTSSELLNVSHNQNVNNSFDMPHPKNQKKLNVVDLDGSCCSHDASLESDANSEIITSSFYHVKNYFPPLERRVKRVLSSSGSDENKNQNTSNTVLPKAKQPKVTKKRSSHKFNQSKGKHSSEHSAIQLNTSKKGSSGADEAPKNILTKPKSPKEAKEEAEKKIEKPQVKKFFKSRSPRKTAETISLAWKNTFRFDKKAATGISRKKHVSISSRCGQKVLDSIENTKGDKKEPSKPTKRNLLPKKNVKGHVTPDTNVNQPSRRLLRSAKATKKWLVSSFNEDDKAVQQTGADRVESEAPDLKEPVHKQIHMGSHSESNAHVSESKQLLMNCEQIAEISESEVLASESGQELTECVQIPMNVHSISETLASESEQLLPECEQVPTQVHSEVDAFETREPLPVCKQTAVNMSLKSDVVLVNESGQASSQCDVTSVGTYSRSDFNASEFRQPRSRRKRILAKVHFESDTLISELKQLKSRCKQTSVHFESGASTSEHKKAKLSCEKIPTKSITESDTSASESRHLKYRKHFLAKVQNSFAASASKQLESVCKQTPAKDSSRSELPVSESEQPLSHKSVLQFIFDDIERAFNKIEPEVSVAQHDHHVSTETVDDEILNGHVLPFEASRIHEGKKQLYPVFYTKEKGDSFSSQTKDHDKSLNKTKIHKASPKVPAADEDKQLIIDAGQKVIGPVVCSSCGMVCHAGSAQDESLHKSYHEMFVNDLKFPGWKKEHVVRQFHDGRIIMITKNDRNFMVKKVEEVLNVIDRDLGFRSARFPKHPDAKFLLFIADKKVVGCLVAEPISVAHRVEMESPSKVSSCYPEGSDMKPDRWCSSENEVKAVCGISRIWVSPAYRRKKIATRLLDYLRCSFLYGYYVSTDEMAFSDPSADGREFIATYTKTNNFLVYK